MIADRSSVIETIGLAGVAQDDCRHEFRRAVSLRYFNVAGADPRGRAIAHRNRGHMWRETLHLFGVFTVLLR
jgi:UDP-glucose 4-epimerase